MYDEEEEEQTDLGRHFRVKSVPLFKFFKGGEEVESFAARERSKVAEAINRHAGAGTVDV